MKKAIIFVAMLVSMSSSSYSQTNEKAEKRQIASGNRTTQPSVSPSTEIQQKRSVISRDYQTQPPRQQPRNYLGNIYDPRYSPYFSPFDFRRRYDYYNYPWSRYFWYDDWGFRNYSRIYIVENGKPDTVHMKPLHGSVGLQFSKGELGGFLSLGKKIYFLAEYQSTYQRDISTFYPDLTRERALAWGDKRLEDVVKNQIFYVGLGKRYGRTGVHLSLGFGKERQRYQFEDEYFLLSNNGRYSIRNYEDNFVSYKMGVLHNYKKITLKADVDFYRPKAMVGVGLNF
jgi:hypothetical protein